MINGKRYLVTGAGEGLGRKIVEKLLRQGHFVTGLCLDIENNRDLEKLYPNQYLSLPFAFSYEAKIASIVDEAWRKGKDYDVVISNAGYILFGAAEENNEFELNDLVDGFFKGSIRFLSANISHLRKRKGGTIIQITGRNVFLPTPGTALFSASVAGLDNYMSALRKELAPFSIACGSVEVGTMNTSFYSGSMRVSNLKEEYDATPAHEFLKEIDDPNEVALEVDLAADEIIAHINKPIIKEHLTIGEADRIKKKNRLNELLLDLDCHEGKKKVKTIDEKEKANKKRKSKPVALRDSASALFRPGRRKRTN